MTNWNEVWAELQSKANPNPYIPGPVHEEPRERPYRITITNRRRSISPSPEIAIFELAVFGTLAVFGALCFLVQVFGLAK